MHRVLLEMAIVAAASGSVWAQAANDASPRSLLLKGRYEEAAARYAELADGDATAAIGLARCQRETGKRDEARATLETAAAKFPKSAALSAELALLALERGDQDAAERDSAAALALDKNCIAGRFAAAELLHLSGQFAEAEKGYAWLVEHYNRAPAIDDPADLVLIARGSAEHARWTRNSNQFRRLTGDLLPAVLRRWPDYWPAHLVAAQLFAEKFNEAEAAVQIARGLAINPNAAELHAAKAQLALDRFDLAAAKSSLERALEINPRLTEAHRLTADALLADLRPAEAVNALAKAVALNPRDEATLGRLLAAHLAQTKPGGVSAEADQIIMEVTARNPNCGELYLAAGEAFDRMRRFPAAAQHYRLAAERMPRLLAPRGRLGLVLMRLGQEAEGAKLLEESFAIDPFNVRVKNMLEVLDLLKNYAVTETEHFILKFDRGQDELLARLAARQLEEEIYPQLTALLGYAPPDKTLIEIFSKSARTSGHSWFSARMVGLPFIGTVGACAGKMIALTSPEELTEKFDWALVLRHEFVHVLNLQQTDFAVPHWLTEGLAVHLENRPRPQKWLALLASRADDDRLFNLDNLTLGFIRPQSSDDWTLAYCQAELYVDYLLTTYGPGAIAKLLAAYADRCTTAEALERCYGVKQGDLEAGYSRYVDRVLAESGRKAKAAKLTLAQLQRRADDAPDNANTAADLALAWLERDDKPQARRWAVKARQIEPQQPLAAYVLARLQLSIGDPEGAVKLLESALDKQQPFEELLGLLAALKLQLGDAAAAEELYQQADKSFPTSDRWIKGLARIYLQSGDNAKLLPVLRRWSSLEPDNSAIHKKLAKLWLETRDFKAAEKSATQLLHFNVQDAEAHALLGAALAGQDKAAAAIAEYEVAIRLDGQQSDWYAELARLQIGLGRKEDARLVIDRLREMAPQHNQLSELEASLAK